MRNTLPVQPGICATCRTFIEPSWGQCVQCHQQPENLDVVVPISYSVHGGQVHLALRNYKDGYGAAVRHARVRIAAILWRFLEAHEPCIAAAAGVERFDLVTTVPSTDPVRDQNSPLWTIAGWCKPIASRLERVLVPSGKAPSTHSFALDRYAANRDLAGANALIIDDTWTTGAHARSAGAVLRTAGARKIAMVAIGRHVRPDWQVGDETSGDLVGALGPFDWDRCCLDTPTSTCERV